VGKEVQLGFEKHTPFIYPLSTETQSIHILCN